MVHIGRLLAAHGHRCVRLLEQAIARNHETDPHAKSIEQGGQRLTNTASYNDLPRDEARKTLAFDMPDAVV